MRVRRGPHGGVKIDLVEVEAGILGQCVRELLELLSLPAPDQPPDPLAMMVGLSPGATLSQDPALARLLPDAYADDPEAAGDFRRWTEADLRATKVRNAETMLAALPVGDARVVLDRDQADAWLFALNDVRLALGARLEVTEDFAFDALDLDEGRRHGLQVFGWLGLVQESLVEHLVPRPDASR